MRNSIRNFIIKVSYNTKFMIISYIVLAAVAFSLAFICKKAFIAFTPIFLMIPFEAVRNTSQDTVNRNNLILICLADYHLWSNLIVYGPLIVSIDSHFPFTWLTAILYIIIIFLLAIFLPERIAKLFQKKLKK